MGGGAGVVKAGRWRSRILRPGGLAPDQCSSQGRRREWPASNPGDPALTDQYEDLQQSYGRCLRGGRFIERFYEVFMDSHPSVRPMFATTDMGTQRLALRRGISVAIFHAAGSALSRRTTEEMARVHSCAGRSPVDPALYPYWVESLVQVVGETDPEATPALLARWRAAMEVVCGTFTRQYRAA